MPSSIQVIDRYCDDAKSYVVGAAITFDNKPVTAQSPRTLANGRATIATEKMADGKHPMKITPAYTSQLPSGPNAGIR